jgi:hypothetical protein
VAGLSAVVAGHEVLDPVRSVVAVPTRQRLGRRVRLDGGGIRVAWAARLRLGGRVGHACHAEGRTAEMPAETTERAKVRAMLLIISEFSCVSWLFSFCTGAFRR